jgi:hypothetical protein
VVLESRSASVLGQWPRSEHRGSSTRPKFAKDHFRVDQTAGLNVFIRIPESLMHGCTIFLAEAISVTEKEKVDFRPVREVGRLVNDQPTVLHSSLQYHDGDSSADRMSAIVGEGGSLALSEHYPVSTRGLKSSESFSKGDVHV